MKMVRTKAKTVARKAKKSPSDQSCAICKAKIQAKINRKRNAEIARIPKSARVPNRPYGGHLCVKCTRNLATLKASLEADEIKKEDVDFRFRKYL